MALEEMRAILEGLLKRLASSLSGSDLGEVLDHLVWLTDDNGHDIFEVCREWLESGERRKVEAGLGLSEAFLYNDRETYERVLLPIAARWPDLAGQVQEKLDVFNRQFPNGSVPSPRRPS
ncbi:hypothetical protein [Actinoplanes sp. HUAS TT8]|uniref:hypothetical protein n=1 Tax=Actinoplanes sp. HUAS TT8 TaxID=3447453 RepID=UPI003F52226D